MPHLARPIAVLVTPRRDSRAPCPSPTPSANAACVFALRVPKSNGRAPQARTTQHAQSLMTSRPQAQQASPDHGQLAADAVSPPHSPFLLPLRSISLHVQLQRPVGRASMRTARLTTCMLVERPIASEHPAASGRDLPHPRRPLYRTRVCVCTCPCYNTALTSRGRPRSGQSSPPSSAGGCLVGRVHQKVRQPHGQFISRFRQIGGASREGQRVGTANDAPCAAAGWGRCRARRRWGTSCDATAADDDACRGGVLVA